MEEVVERFESLGNNDVGNKKTDFEDMYKNWGRLSNQEQRRKDLLDVQKSNRKDKLDRIRGIVEIVNDVEQHNLWREKSVRYRPQIYVSGFNKSSSSYRDVLMMSEWFVEKPEDFEEKWLIVPCPKGVRMIVIANRGTTKCYTKYGQFKFETVTALPGGHRSDPKHKCCVLDCFYQVHNNTMYVLDLLAWNNQTMTDGETEFRHFWITSKFSELPQLKIISKINKMFFTILPKIPCDKRSLNEFLCKFPAFECNFPPLDGFLFYHKEGHYIGQETPLVGWLFPYMVNEILGQEYQVHPAYLAQKPAGYINQKVFIEKFELANAKKKPSWCRRNKGDAEMDATDVENTELGSMDADNMTSAEYYDEDNAEVYGSMEADENIEAPNENETTELAVNNLTENVDKSEKACAEASMDEVSIEESKKIDTGPTGSAVPFDGNERHFQCNDNESSLECDPTDTEWVVINKNLDTFVQNLLDD